MVPTSRQCHRYFASLHMQSANAYSLIQMRILPTTLLLRPYRNYSSRHSFSARRTRFNRLLPNPASARRSSSSVPMCPFDLPVAPVLCILAVTPPLRKFVTPPPWSLASMLWHFAASVCLRIPSEVYPMASATLCKQAESFAINSLNTMRTTASSFMLVRIPASQPVQRGT